MKKGRYCLFAILFLTLAASFLWAQSPEILKDEWRSVHIAGSKAGYSHDVLKKVYEDGAILYVNAHIMEMSLKRMGSVVTITQELETVENDSGMLERFKHVMNMSQQETVIEGTVAEGKVLLKTKVLGMEREMELPWDEDALPPYAAHRLVVSKGFEPGTSYSYKAFLPSQASLVSNFSYKVIGKEEVDILGEKMTLNLLEQENDIVPGIKVKVWIDDEGTSYKELSPLLGGTESYLTTQEFAMGETKEAELDDTILSTFIKSNVVLPHPYRISEVLYRIKMKDGDFPDLQLEDDRQRIEEMGQRELLLRVSAIEPGEDRTFPEKGDPELADFTSPNSYIQSDDPDIRKIARETAGHQSDPWLRCKELEKWVYNNIDKKGYGVGFASAKEVLERREGDCSEHGVLLAALTRSMDLPSRLVLGLLYFQGGFGWHLWTEARIGDRWYPLDGTLGYDTVDATHIKFASDSLKGAYFSKGMGRIATLLGNLEIEILEFTLDGETYDPAELGKASYVRGKTYANPLVGITVKRPNRWKFEVSEGYLTGKLVDLVKTGGGKERIGIHASSVPYNFTLPSLVSELEKAATIITKRERAIAGYPGMELLLENPDSKERSLHAFLLEGDTLYSVILNDSSDAAMGAYRSVLKNLLINGG